jgi:carbonic anhydrase
VVDDFAIGSVEYGVEHLGASLIVVLGHAGCGAVKAAVGGGEIPGHLKSVIDAIEPAVAEAKSQPGDLLQNSIRDNISLSMKRLKEAPPVLDHLTKEGKIRVVGAYYHLDSGKVEKL